MYFITTKRMLEVCFFQHTPTFIIEPLLYAGKSVPARKTRGLTAILFYVMMILIVDRRCSR